MTNQYNQFFYTRSGFCKDISKEVSIGPAPYNRPKEPTMEAIEAKIEEPQEIKEDKN